MKVLVTGGAGYIGAHVVRLLLERGDEVAVVDDLSTGERARVQGATLLEQDLAADGAQAAVAAFLRETEVEAVVHLAARKDVGESVARPLWYYQQNVTGLAHVLDAAVEARVHRVVFSSSAAVYGATGADLVTEDAMTSPVNPYGRSKLAGEWLLDATAQAADLRHVSLRYFNVAGAGWPELGDPAVQNLVTIALDRWARGEPVVVHGGDYPTRDGSGVRDYVHVLDLARAHLAALDQLDRSIGLPPVLNIGTGSGTSVLEMLGALAAAAGDGAGETRVGPRRVGDPAHVVADTTRAAATLGWRAEHDVTDIATSAWQAASHRS